MPGPFPHPADLDDLRRKSADQWKVVRWYAAETRWRVRQARGALTGFSVRYANEARQTLRIYAQAWAETRKLIHRLEARKEGCGELTASAEAAMVLSRARALGLMGE